jgi:hypothetical protein
VRLWLQTFFLVFALRSLIQLLKIVFVKCCIQSRIAFDFLRLALVDALLMGWLVYGNKLFYSEANDCLAKGGEAEFLAIIMQVILILGYFSMAVYVGIMVSIPYNLLRYG